MTRTHKTLLAFSLILSISGSAFAQGGGGGRPDIPPVPEEKKPKQEKPTKEPASRPPAPPASGMVDLRPKWEQGQIIRYVMKIRGENNANIPGLTDINDLTDLSKPERQPKPGKNGKPEEKGQRQDMEQEIGFSLHVKSVDADRNATVELIYDRVKASIKTPDGEFVYDSNVPEPKKAPGKEPPASEGADMLKSAMKDIVGSKLTLKFDKNGQITSVEGGGSLTNPGGMSGAGLIPRDAKSVSNIFGPITTRSGPPGEVRIGEKWIDKDEFSLYPMGSLRMVTEHKLVSASNGVANLSFFGKIDPQSEKPNKDDPFTIKESTHQGRYDWDTRTGQLKSMNSNQFIRIELPASPGSFLESTMNVTVTREGSTPIPPPSTPGKEPPPPKR